MDLEEALAFAAGHRRAVVSTFRADGRPQMSPMTAVVDPGNPAGVMFTTRAPSMKVKNLTRDPRVSVLFLRDEFVGEWAIVEGSARITTLPDCMDDLHTIFSGNGPIADLDGWRAKMIADQRVVVHVDIDRVGPNRRG
ncbi:MAG: class F420-dependent enzyme [Pseudonocardiales bacterium]|nr:class F420-dependent enzyme [Jatrophihabitantaceae bacterium]MCW2603009.1 class F420-dependent enzyme [Pseudonocardiales bacterium]